METSGVNATGTCGMGMGASDPGIIMAGPFNAQQLRTPGTLPTARAERLAS